MGDGRKRVTTLENQKNVSVVNIIQEVIETVCDKYCKYPEQYKEKFVDEDLAFDKMSEERCENCILNKLF